MHEGSLLARDDACANGEHDAQQLRRQRADRQQPLDVDAVEVRLDLR